MTGVVLGWIALVRPIGSGGRPPSVVFSASLLATLFCFLVPWRWQAARRSNEQTLIDFSVMNEPRLAFFLICLVSAGFIIANSWLRFYADPVTSNLTIAGIEALQGFLERQLDLQKVFDYTLLIAFIIFASCAILLGIKKYTAFSRVLQSNKLTSRLVAIVKMIAAVICSFNAASSAARGPRRAAIAYLYTVKANAENGLNAVETAVAKRA